MSSRSARPRLTDLTAALTLPLALAMPAAAAEVEIVFEEATNLAATASPDGSELVLDVQGILWRLPASGGEATAISTPELGAARPDWSPVDDTLVFQAYREGTFDIWTMQADGSDPVQHTEGPWDEREPAWSPDGQRVAFASDRSGESYDIWVLEPASGELRRWTDAATEEAYPAWSPDGREIAYVADGAVFATDADGRTRTLVDAGDRGIFSPAWTPDGDDVAYIATSPGKAELVVGGETLGDSADVFPFRPEFLDSGLVLYTADGGIRQLDPASGTVSSVPFSARLTVDRPEYARRDFGVGDFRSGAVKGIVTPALSPDGEQVAFVALSDLWIMRIGEPPRQLTDDAWYESDPAWSPDGTRLAYVSDRDGELDLWIHDLASGEERRLEGISGAELYPAWSPDSLSLAYHDQNGVTHVVDVASGSTRAVAEPTFQPGRPSWSADGTRLAFAAVVPYTSRFREGTSRFRIVDLRSGEARDVAPAPNKSITSRADNGPVWSPDGSALAFIMDGLLHTIAVDPTGEPTGEPIALGSELAESPTWSGDGSRLLYLANGRLRLVDRDGGETRDVPLDLEWTQAIPQKFSLIHAGTLWDGTGHGAVHDRDLLVIGNRIRWVGEHNDTLHHLAAIFGKLIDAPDETLVPGLIEMHTHQTWGNHTYGYGGRQGPLLLSFGITSTHSVGDLAYRAIADREALAAGRRIGPRFFATGEPLDGDRIYYNAMRPMGSERQFELELERAEALGYDSLKTYVRLRPSRMGAAARKAHALGVNVYSHFLSPGVLVGQDGTTHLGATERLDYSRIATLAGNSYDDVVSLFADAGMAVMSTFFVAEPSLFSPETAIVQDERVQRLVPYWERTKLASDEGLFDTPPTSTFVATLPDKAETFATIYRRGGRVLAGTDSPLDTVAVGLHNNLRWLARGGLDPDEVLSTATRLAAEEIGVAEDLGTLEAGKIADIAFVDGMPHVQIEDLSRVTRVMQAGRLRTVDELVARYPVSAAPEEGDTRSRSLGGKAAGHAH